MLHAILDGGYIRLGKLLIMYIHGLILSITPIICQISSCILAEI